MTGSEEKRMRGRGLRKEGMRDTGRGDGRKKGRRDDEIMEGRLRERWDEGEEGGKRG